MVFVADDLGAWLVGLLADAGRRKLTTLVLGTDQERALRSAATEAVRLTAGQLRPGDSEQVEDLAMVIHQVFSEPIQAAPLAVHDTVLEALRAGIEGQLAVLDDASLTGTGQSSADALGVPAPVMAAELSSRLLHEIVSRGARGGPLQPLANQLSHDRTYLLGLRLEGKVDRLDDVLVNLLANMGSIRSASAPVALAQRALADLPAPTVSELADAVPAHITAWRVPLRNPHFIGRERELDQIRSSLINGPTLIVQSIRGLGGIGKTQVAIEYVHRFVHHYDIAWWVDAEDPSTIPIQLSPLAVDLGIASITESSIALELVKAELRRRNRWLMVFDNAEDVDKIRKMLPSGSGHVLITTRRPRFGSLGPVLDLDILSRPEAIELLRRRVLNMDESTAYQLAEELGDLPLGLAQAASYLEETSTPPETYLTLLNSHSNEMRSRGQVDDYPFNLESVWSISIRNLRSISPASIDLLSLCSWMAPDEIPLDLFTKNPSTLPEPLRQLVTDSVAWNECVGYLTIFSLARRTRQGLILHRLTQAVGRSLFQYSTGHPLVTVTELLAHYAQIHDDGYDRSIEALTRWSVVMPHILYVIDHGLRDSRIPRDQIASLMHGAGIYLQTDQKRAESLLRGALRIYEEIDPSDHPAIADVLTDLEWLLEDSGQWDAACEILRRAREVKLAIYGPDDPRIAAIDTHLASSLRGLGYLSEALSLLRHALSVHEKKSGPSHPATATTLNILAMTYQSLGQPRQAKPLLQRAVMIREKVFGEDHYMTATHIANLSMVLADLQEFIEARNLAERALATRERSFGPASYQVGRNLHQLGSICYAMGDLRMATTHLRRSLEIYESIDHPVPYVTEVRDLLGKLAGQAGG